MKLVILCLFFAAAVNPIDNDWGAVKSLADDLRLSLNERLQNKASARIVNGKEARPKQFPYQAHLDLYKHDQTYMCGGSFISNRWVLTAAHCTENLKQGLDVLLGAWSRISSFEPNQHRIFVSTKHVILHEEWKWKGRLNDISLIKLPVVLVFNEYVQPVNLPKKSKTYSTYAGEMSLVSGWGVQAEGIKRLFLGVYMFFRQGKKNLVWRQPGFTGELLSLCVPFPKDSAFQFFNFCN